MSRYRKTFREAMAEVELNEVGYLQPRMNDRQLANIKNVWKHKTKKDITPAVKKMIANMDVPTQLAIKHANINLLSDLIEGRMKDIHQMDKDGKSAAEIAKFLKLDVKTVKGILGEEDSAQDMQDAKPPREIKKEIKEAGDHEISMAKGELEAIADKATKLAAALQSKSDDTDGLEAWVQSKITKAKDYINSASDYMMYNKGDTNEEVEKIKEEKKKKTDIAPEHDANADEEKKEDSKEKLEKEVEKKDQEIAALKQKAETDKAKAIKKDTEKMVNPETGEPLLQIGVAYKHLKDKMKKEEVISEAGITPAMIATLKKEYEPFRGKKISAARARQLMNILNKFKDSDLQKLGKENIPFISSGSRSKLAVRNMKFTVKNIEFGEELDEEMFEACWTGYKQVGMKNKGGKQVPNCVPEETILEKVNEMAKDKAYAIGMSVAKKKYNDEPPLDKKTITKGHEIADKLMKKEEICPKCGKDHGKNVNASNCSYEEVKEFKKFRALISDPTKRQKAVDDLKKKGFDVAIHKDEIYVDGKGADLNKYATDIKNFYNGRIRVRENAPSVADIDRLKKQGLKKENTEHPAAELYEAIAGLKKKADKSGMPYSILKKVYDRGMAAWRGGHRPGASQQQWAFARVNSFITKSSGTWGGADKDLAKQVRGSK